MLQGVYPFSDSALGLSGRRHGVILQVLPVSGFPCRTPRLKRTIATAKPAAVIERLPVSNYPSDDWQFTSREIGPNIEPVIPP